jgi:crossover junction endodeoxyribonuclease RuvC
VVVLGIDPGSRRCGYGVVARAGTRLLRMASGVIAPGDLPMPERLARILDRLGALLEHGGIDAVAVETAFCGLSPRSALALGQARGIALAAAARAGMPVFEFAPSEVKRAFTGNGRAEKAQMVRTARALFGGSARLSDEADALAVAVCCLARRLRPVPVRLRAAARIRSTSDVEARLALDGSARLRPSVRRFGAT